MTTERFLAILLFITLTIPVYRQFALGNTYIKSRSVQKDRVKDKKLTQILAKQRLVDSHLLLGQLATQHNSKSRKEFDTDNSLIIYYSVRALVKEMAEVEYGRVRRGKRKTRMILSKPQELLVRRGVEDFISKFKSEKQKNPSVQKIKEEINKQIVRLNAVSDPTNTSNFGIPGLLAFPKEGEKQFNEPLKYMNSMSTEQIAVATVPKSLIPSDLKSKLNEMVFNVGGNVSDDLIESLAATWAIKNDMKHGKAALKRFNRLLNESTKPLHFTTWRGIIFSFFLFVLCGMARAEHEIVREKNQVKSWAQSSTIWIIILQFLIWPIMVVFEVTRFLFFLKSNRREKDRIVTLLSSILGVGVIVTLVWAVANIFGDNLLGMLVFVGLIFVIVKWRFMPEKIKD